jgi:oligoribonuclease
MTESTPPTPTPAYLWFDTEFTSLDPSQARLLQVALLVTDINLNRLTPPEDDLNICIALEDGAPVSGWVEENLADLLAQCRSDTAVPVAEADAQLAALVDKAVGPAAKDIADRPVLAGNAVHMDLLMARLFLPDFEKRLHYRLLDVSTLKLLWNDHHPGEAFEKDTAGAVAANLPDGIAPPTGEAHDAYYDIHASLAEMNYYRGRLLT